MASKKSKSSPSTSASIAKPKRDPVFYTESAIRVFRVEDGLFRISTGRLERHSQVFRDLFALPMPHSGSLVEGVSDDKPIVLEGAKKADFIALLKVLYPPSLAEVHSPSARGVAGRTSKPKLDVQQWISVYHLASMWLMDDVMDLSVKKVNAAMSSKSRDSDPFQKILLGREYKREDWVLAGYEMVVSKRTDIPADMVDQIGVHAVVKLLSFMLQNRGHPKQPSLQEVFKDEIDAIVRQETAFGGAERFPKSTTRKAQGKRSAPAAAPQARASDTSDSSDSSADESIPRKAPPAAKKRKIDSDSPSESDSSDSD